jgi:hypothetical protein
VHICTLSSVPLSFFTTSSRTVGSDIGIRVLWLRTTAAKGDQGAGEQQLEEGEGEEDVERQDSEKGEVDWVLRQREGFGFEDEGEVHK